MKMHEKFAIERLSANNLSINVTKQGVTYGYDLIQDTVNTS